MNYQFDYEKFCETFNVKTDKAVDSLRLTHTQDICFKLFPYKASGKAQAPIVTELDGIVSGFFRKALGVETEPVEFEALCNSLIEEMDIEDEDVEFFKDVIQSLFFEDSDFVAKNLGLYPFQTRMNNKSEERLAGFLLNILGVDQHDCIDIGNAMDQYQYNVIEKMVVEAINATKTTEKDTEISYFPIIIDVQEKFKKDFNNNNNKTRSV